MSTIRVDIWYVIDFYNLPKELQDSARELWHEWDLGNDSQVQIESILEFNEKTHELWKPFMQQNDLEDSYYIHWSW